MSVESVPVIVAMTAELYVALHSKSIREQFPETKIMGNSFACA